MKFSLLIKMTQFLYCYLRTFSFSFFVFLCVFIVMCWGNSKTQKPGEISYPNPKTDTQNPNWNPTTCKTRIKNHKIVTRLHCYFCNTYFTKKKPFKEKSMTFREKNIINLNYCIKEAGDVLSVFLQKKKILDMCS